MIAHSCLSVSAFVLKGLQRSFLSNGHCPHDVGGFFCPLFLIMAARLSPDFVLPRLLMKKGMGFDLPPQPKCSHTKASFWKQVSVTDVKCDPQVP